MVGPCVDPDWRDTKSQVIHRVMGGVLPQGMADHKLRAQKGCLIPSGPCGAPSPDYSTYLVHSCISSAMNPNE